jgi:CHASE2 domain-containing sensor protein
MVVSLSIDEESQLAGLIDKLRKQKAKVIAIDLSLSDLLNKAKPKGSLYYSIKNAKEIVLPTVVSESYEIPKGFAKEFTKTLSYQDSLENISSGFANFGLASLDSDNTIRRAVLFDFDKNKVNFSFPLIILLKFLDLNPSDLNFSEGESLQFKNYYLPFDNNGTVKINFTKKISLVEDFTDIDNYFLKNKIVLLAKENNDYLFSTPVNEKMSLAEVHANILTTVLENKTIYEFPVFLNLLLIFFAGIFGSMFALRPLRGIIYHFIFVLLWLALSFLFLRYLRLSVPIVYFIFPIFLSLMFVNMFRFYGK